MNQQLKAMAEAQSSLGTDLVRRAKLTDSEEAQAIYIVAQLISTNNLLLCELIAQTERMAEKLGGS